MSRDYFRHVASCHRDGIHAGPWQSLWQMAHEPSAEGSMELLERPLTSDQYLSDILGALVALKRGDGSVRLPAHWTGLPGKVAEALNDVVDLNQRMSDELAHL